VLQTAKAGAQQGGFLVAQNLLYSECFNGSSQKLNKRNKSARPEYDGINPRIHFRNVHITYTCLLTYGFRIFVNIV